MIRCLRNINVTSKGHVATMRYGRNRKRYLIKIKIIILELKALVMPGRVVI